MTASGEEHINFCFEQAKYTGRPLRSYSGLLQAQIVFDLMGKLATTWPIKVGGNLVTFPELMSPEQV